MEVRVVENDIPDDFLYASQRTGISGDDIETTGLKAKEDKLAVYTMYVPGFGVYIVRNVGKHSENILHHLQDATVDKVFHHAPFDLSFLIHHLHADPFRIKDTRLAAKILDPSKEHIKNRSLGPLIEQMLCIHIEKGEALSDWFAPELTPAQIRYAQEDVIHLPNLYYTLRNKLIEIPNLYYDALAAFDYLPTYVRFQLDGTGDVFGR